MNNNINEVNHYIYFDGKQMSGFLATACIVTDFKKSLRPVASLTETEPSVDGNQFTAVLKSLLTAVKCIKDNKITGRVVLQNQNKTVINWLLSGRCNPTYAGLFDQVVEELASLQFQCEMFIQPVEAKENRAKKVVAKVQAPKSQALGMSRLVFANGTSHRAGDRFISPVDYSNPITELDQYRRAVNSR